MKSSREVREAATLAERERIIKLLEDNWVEPMDWLSTIALIKGEGESK
jgi:malonyl CoA-acyl carrier protein transacylase